MPEANSSTISAVTYTGSVERGMTGKCVTSLISGAISAAAIELAAPGVPPSTVLAPQFWPLLFDIAALISSSDLPPPSAAVYHSQP